jgi:hypothetical protein
VRTEAASDPVSRRGLEARPELYGLALFAQMITPGARLVHASLSESPGLHLKAWAVKSRQLISVLLINKGPRSARVLLHTRSIASALLDRLSAPSIGSRSHVTLAGRWIGHDGQWHGHDSAAILHPRRGTYKLLVAGYSAVLVKLKCCS